MNKENIDNKIIATLMFIDYHNNSMIAGTGCRKESGEFEVTININIDRATLAMYGYLETAEKLLKDKLVGCGDTYNGNILENRTYSLEPSGIQLINDFLIAQGYMSKPKTSKGLAYHPV